MQENLGIGRRKLCTQVLDKSIEFNFMLDRAPNLRTVDPDQVVMMTMMATRMMKMMMMMMMMMTTTYCQIDRSKAVQGSRGCKLFM